MPVKARGSGCLVLTFVCLVVVSFGVYRGSFTCISQNEANVASLLVSGLGVSVWANSVSF